MTEVVAALIFQKNKFLICQRPAHKARGLMWEFVGGKVEPGEDHKEALVRECQEELDVTVRVGDVYFTVEHKYPDITVRLSIYHACIIEGTIQMLEHNDIRWITPDEIPQYTFCPADRDILAAITNSYQSYSKNIADKIKSCQDFAYKEFQTKLIPNIDSDAVIGVRVPNLRKLATAVSRSPDVTLFLSMLPHCSYEENILHAILISQHKTIEETVAALDTFLPYVDNWAVCDTIAPKVFKSHSDSLLSTVKHWLRSDHPYTVRYAIGVLLRYFLSDGYSPEQLEWVCDISSQEYYVKMMVAWYFATALAFQYDDAITFLENKKLTVWIHNKTIQKALESYRIPDQRKDYLRSLRIK